MIKCSVCKGVGRTLVLGHCKVCNGTGKLTGYIIIKVPESAQNVRIAVVRKRWRFREEVFNDDGFSWGPWQNEESVEACSNGVTTLPFMKAGHTYQIYVGDTGEVEVLVFFHGRPYGRGTVNDGTAN